MEFARCPESVLHQRASLYTCTSVVKYNFINSHTKRYSRGLFPGCCSRLEVPADGILQKANVSGEGDGGVCSARAQEDEMQQLEGRGGKTALTLEVKKEAGVEEIMRW